MPCLYITPLLHLRLLHLRYILHNAYLYPPNLSSSLAHNAYVCFLPSSSSLHVHTIYLRSPASSSLDMHDAHLRHPASSSALLYMCITPIYLLLLLHLRYICKVTIHGRFSLLTHVHNAYKAVPLRSPVISSRHTCTTIILPLRSPASLSFTPCAFCHSYVYVLPHLNLCNMCITPFLPSRLLCSSSWSLHARRTVRAHWSRETPTEGAASP